MMDLKRLTFFTSHVVGVVRGVSKNWVLYVCAVTLLAGEAVYTWLA